MNIVKQETTNILPKTWRWRIDDGAGKQGLVDYAKNKLHAIITFADIEIINVRNTSQQGKINSRNEILTLSPSCCLNAAFWTGGTSAISSALVMDHKITITI